MIDLFWEIRRGQRLSDFPVGSGPTPGPSRDGSVESRIDRLTQTVERLTLINQAMWSLIQDKTDLTEDDLIARVKEIDAEDGTVDGKVTRGMIPCPKCRRPFSQQHAKCLYCGYAEPVNSAFDWV